MSDVKAGGEERAPRRGRRAVIVAIAAAVIAPVGWVLASIQRPVPPPAIDLATGYFVALGVFALAMAVAVRRRPRGSWGVFAAAMVGALGFLPLLPPAVLFVLAALRGSG